MKLVEILSPTSADPYPYDDIPEIDAPHTIQYTLKPKVGTSPDGVPYTYVFTVHITNNYDDSVNDVASNEAFDVIGSDALVWDDYIVKGKTKVYTACFDITPEQAAAFQDTYEETANEYSNELANDQSYSDYQSDREADRADYEYHRNKEDF